MTPNHVTLNRISRSNESRRIGLYTREFLLHDYILMSEEYVGYDVM